MPTITFETLIPVLTSLIFLIPIVVVFLRQDTQKEKGPWWFLTFLGIGLVWSVFLALSQFELISIPITKIIAKSGLILSIVTLMGLTRTGLLDPRRVNLYLIGGALWLVLYLSIELGLIQISPGLSTGLLVLGWLIFMISSAESIIKARRSASAPLVRARTYYWSIGVITIAIGSVFFIIDLYLSGILLFSLGTLILSVTLLRPYMPDIRLIEYSILNYLVMTILTAFVLILGAIAVASLLIRAQLIDNLTMVGVIIAFIMAALLAPLWNISHAIARHLLPQYEYSPEHILQEYNQSVSNVLNPEKYSQIAASTIHDAMKIQDVSLFLVEQESEEGKTRYRLRSSSRKTPGNWEAFLISYDSPIANYFRNQQQPLRQADLKYLPHFTKINPQEHAWLKSLGAEIFVPVHAKGDWIGLFSLGPKMNGQPYTEKDLMILGILADQTAMSMQNANLVESLMRVNNDFRRAYSAMEQANIHLKKVNRQLEGLDRTKSEFISVASHELLTPLTIMRGYNEMLLEDKDIKNNPSQSKLVDGIHTGILRMNEIISSMLDIASIDTRSMELHLEHVSISSLIQNIQKSLSTTLKERNLTLEATNLSDLPPVDGDSEALHKVFYQVIINAVKYTPDGGKIIVTGVPVSAGQLGMIKGGVEIIISDTGIGINPENLELIFSKFFQTGNLSLQTSSKTIFKGSGPGLGLAIAKGIVEAHRGLIWAQSPGLDEVELPGSTFHIVLPLHFKSQPLPPG